MSDDLTELSGFRADLDPPSPETEAAARADLFTAMSRERRAAPPDRVPRRRPDRRRVWALRGAIVAGLAAAIVAIAGVPGSQPADTPPSAAAAVFNHLADVAAGQPSTTPKHGKWLYVDSTEAYDDIDGGTGCTVLSPETRQIWIGNGTALDMLRESFGRASYTSAQDRALCVAHHETSMLSGQAASNDWFGADCLTDGPVNESRLPTDPAKLRRLLVTGRIEGGPPGAAEQFVQIGDLLRETDASPALRAAIYHVAATIRGVRSLGVATDHAGRRGIGLAFHNRGGAVSELIFNPTTSALMGETYLNAAGAVDSWAVYWKLEVVDRISFRKPNHALKPCVNFEAGPANQATTS
jgi:hypothetical protein